MGLFFLISLSNSSLYLYKNAVEFCILISYPANLLNSLMRSNSFLWHFYDFLCIVSCHLQRQFYFFLSNMDSFYLFSSLIAVARTSHTTLNKIGESGNSSLVPDLRGTAFSFSLLSVTLIVCLLYMAFIIFSYVPSISTLWRVFIINGC